MTFEEIAEISPFSLQRAEKRKILCTRMNTLTRWHADHCDAYGRVCRCLKGSGASDSRELEDVPFLPVRMFKDMDLCSVSTDAVVKTMTSSGTTGQQVSKIYLDRTTAANQQKAMVKIVSDFTGHGRLPMLIIDSPAVVKDRRMFSARGAGILGFSILASDRQYALTEDMDIDWEGITAFMKKHAGKRILLFGFTFMIWQYFCRVLEESGRRLALENGVLIHGGGWKKLKNEAVEPAEFKRRLQQVCGIREIHDYYGMVEQTGCIYMECEYGHLHASIFSDVITRRFDDFSPCEFGEEGVLQVLSVIPESYPGHSILTEDQGIILGEDDCPCGRLGKYFRITGRMKDAEIRGCSDTYEG